MSLLLSLSLLASCFLSLLFFFLGQSFLFFLGLLLGFSSFSSLLFLFFFEYSGLFSFLSSDSFSLFPLFFILQPLFLSLGLGSLSLFLCFLLLSSCFLSGFLLLKLLSSLLLSFEGGGLFLYALLFCSLLLAEFGSLSFGLLSLFLCFFGSSFCIPLLLLIFWINFFSFWLWWNFRLLFFRRR